MKMPPDPAQIRAMTSRMGSRSTFKHPLPVDHGFDVDRMLGIIRDNWRLNRSAVNPDTDQCAAYLAQHLGGRVLEAHSGEECLTWRIPRRWAVRRGVLRRGNGDVIADYDDNPLHLWTHSVAFQGTVSREDLLAHHVVTDPDRPDEIVYHYRNGFQYDVREWGFSLPYRVVASLGDESYQVEIDADLDDEGSVKVVDAYLPGALPETLFFMAHTCHPAQVSDGIGSIAVAVELFHDLKALPHRRYSYRFLFGPEYFAAAAYLTKAGSEAVGNLHLGCYLDMMTTHEPLGFQASMQGDSRLDKVAANVMQSHLTTQVGRPFRGLWGNDETFYNGPGYNIPTIGIGRVMHREYHYDSDNLDNFSAYRAVESVWILKRIVEVFETDYLPVREYQGPLYLSRFGLYVDPVKDRVGAVDLERMQVLMDGRHSCMDIAEALGMDFFFVRNLCDKMAGFGLVSKAPRPPREGDRGSR